jgi:hypothetical protein
MSDTALATDAAATAPLSTEEPPPNAPSINAVSSPDDPQTPAETASRLADSATAPPEFPPAPAPDSDPDEAKNQTPLPAKARQRRGKVARLAKHVRHQISLMLLDGIPYQKIIQNLGEEGKGLTQNCISTYKAGGHQDWRKEQRLLEDCRLRHELIFDLGREEQGIDAFQAAHKIAAALICEAIADIGADSLRQAVKLNPLNFLRMLNSLSRLTAGGLTCERFLCDESQRKAEALQQSLPDSKKGLSPEAVTEMKAKLRLM